MLLTSLLPDLILMVPGCPEPTAERALRDAARQFCRDTYVIAELSEEIPTAAGDPTVALSDLAESQREIVGVLEMYLDGRIIKQVSRDWLRNKSRKFSSALAGTPSEAYSIGETQLRLSPTPDDAYTLQFLLATAPTATATQIADDLGNRWKHALIGRAVSILCAHPEREYTNLKLVDYGARQYFAGVGKARVEVNRSFGRDARVVMRGFL